MKRKKYDARFPVARIKKIMQADEEVGKIATLSPIVMSSCVESFCSEIVKKAALAAGEGGRTVVAAAHLKRAIVEEPRFDFVRDVVASVPEFAPPAVEKRRKRKSGRQDSADTGNRSAHSKTSPDSKKVSRGKVRRPRKRKEPVEVSDYEKPVTRAKRARRSIAEAVDKDIYSAEESSAESSGERVQEAEAQNGDASDSQLAVSVEDRHRSLLGSPFDTPITPGARAFFAASTMAPVDDDEDYDQS